MAETYFLVKPTTIKYTGVMNIEELYNMIDEWFSRKGFDKHELKCEELVESGGRYIELLLEPWHKFTDYLKEVIRVHIRIYRVKDVKVKIDGHTIKMQEGEIHFFSEGFFQTDYQDRWEERPLYFFFRTLIDKYIYRIYNQKYEKELKSRCSELRADVKAFLNLYRFKVEK
jgi:hypothetical protein